MDVSSTPSQASPAWKEKFSRQWILPGVGIAGQNKWLESIFLLAGEGEDLEAAGLGLATSGVRRLRVWPSHSFDSSCWTSRVSGLTVETVVPETAGEPANVPAVVLTEEDPFRGKLNRVFRQQGRPALFGWASGKGVALFFSRPGSAREHRPCVECFQSLNPKAFGQGSPEMKKFLGAMAAAEILQWVLRENSPLEGKVWIFSPDEGVSFHHQVTAIPKCPAALSEKGARFTP